MATILLELSFIMDKRKQGIALFITLMVIASIMSIIAVSFTYLEKVQKDAGTTSAVIQGNLLYKNTVSILKRFFPAGQDKTEQLKLLYTMPLMLNEPKSGFNLNMTCSALMVGVPIAWLDVKSTQGVAQKQELAQKVLATVMQLYDIEEPNRLEELLLQAITGRVERNVDYSPRIKTQKGIVSKEQFYRIITDYRLLYDDDKVLTVPWEKYFSFVKVEKKTKIDGLFLSAELISVAFDIPVEIVQDSWIIGESTLVEFLRSNAVSEPVNKNIFANKAINAMHCEQIYLYRERHYTFNFDYIEGRSGNFDFNAQE